ELINRKVFTKEELQVDTDYFLRFKEANPFTIEGIGLQHINLKAASDEIRKRNAPSSDGVSKKDLASNKAALSEATFAHLHNHTQFSVLQSTISVKDLVKAAAK